MEAVLVIAAALIVLVGLLLIAIYLTYDKYRFQIERQFSSVSKGIHAAMSCSVHGEAYVRLKKTTEKLSFLAEIFPIPELAPYQGYFDVHNELAHKFNYKLSASVFRRILPLLGFRPFPIIAE